MKIIEGTKGLFVAMPAVKTKVACPRCHHRNVIRSNYCNQCGAGIPPLPEPVEPVEDKRVSEYTDIAHPITGECREHIQDRVLREYRRAAEQAAAVSEAECSRAVA